MPYINLVTEIPGPKGRAIIERRSAAVSAGLARATDVVIARGQGALIEDVDGNTLIDLVGGIGMLAVGHAHPRVVAAVQEQVEKLTHTCALVATYEPYVALAERLNAMTPGAFSKRTLLANSGSEAVENAVKLARSFTGRSAILTFEGGYHGRTLLTLSMTSKYGLFKKGFGPFAPEIYRIPAPYAYRRPRSMSEQDYLEWMLQRLDDALISQVDASSLAAIVIEPVQGEAGFIPIPTSYLQKIRDLCDANGIVMIADEVQSGFMRTGRMFAIEHSKVVPDLITMAKSLGGGLPISAVTGRAEIMDATHPGGVGGTFGGSPVACAAALAVIETLESAEFQNHLGRMARHLEERLDSLEREFSLIGDHRGLGPMRLLELVEDRTTKVPVPSLTLDLVRAAARRGVIMMRAGLYSNGIRLLPPLNIPLDVLDEALDVLGQCLTEVSAKPRSS